MSKSIRITDAEWEVMAVVWEKSPVAASEVASVLEKKKRWWKAPLKLSQVL